LTDLWRLVPGDSRADRKNFLLNTVEGALFVASQAFVNPQTVLPALVNRLGGTNVAVGALGVLVYFGVYVPQIFAARYVETLPRKKRWALGFGAAHRVFVLFMALVILLFGAGRPLLALWLFLVLYAVMQVLIGIATPGWFDFFARMTPPRRRGRLVGIRNSLGGGGAFVCGLCLTWILADIAFPVSFALAFFAAFLLQAGSIVTQTRVRYPPAARSSHFSGSSRTFSGRTPRSGSL